MASRTSRKEWVRGLPSAFGVGRNDRKRVHSASERSVGYVFLIEESVQNYPNPHPYQTGSKKLVCSCAVLLLARPGPTARRHPRFRRRRSSCLRRRSSCL